MADKPEQLDMFSGLLESLSGASKPETSAEVVSIACTCLELDARMRYVANGLLNAPTLNAMQLQLLSLILVQLKYTH